MMYNIAQIDIALNELPKMPDIKQTGNPAMDTITNIVIIIMIGLIAYRMFEKLVINRYTNNKNNCVPPAECPHVLKIKAEMQNKINLQEQELNYLKKDLDEIKEKIQELIKNQNKTYVAVQSLNKDLMRITKER